jgi:uncharacterized damage-inducible protein DinB
MNFKALYERNLENRKRMFQQLQGIKSEDLTKPFGPSRSIRDLLVHILRVENWYIGGVLLKNEVKKLEMADFTTVNTILLEAEKTQERTLNYLASVHPTATNQEQTHDAGDRRMKFTIEQILLQINLHQAYHFGQINMIIRQLGYEPLKGSETIYRWEKK